MDVGLEVVDDVAAGAAIAAVEIDANRALGGFHAEDYDVLDDFDVVPCFHAHPPGTAPA